MLCHRGVWKSDHRPSFRPALLIFNAFVLVVKRITPPESLSSPIAVLHLILQLRAVFTDPFASSIAEYLGKHCLCPNQAAWHLQECRGELKA